MDKKRTKDIILLSIKPVYAHAIFSGEKTVEFRKNGIPENVKKIVMYSTKPDQKIFGYINIEECIIDRPEVLWERFGNEGYISYEDFKSYYGEKKSGKCFKIEKVYPFKNPVPLSKCRSFSSSPQSFTYLLQSEWKNLKRKRLAI